MAAYILFALPSAILAGWRSKADVIHAHFAVPSGVVGALAALILRRPYILTIQGGDTPSFLPEQTARVFSLITPVARAIWKRAASVHVVGHGLMELARADYPGIDMDVIPNGVADEFFGSPLPVAPDAPLHLVFVGRLSIQKNVDVLSRALALLAEHPGWKATLVGDGPMRPQVEAILAEAGIEDRVTLTGWVPRDAVIRILRSSQIAALPSRIEGFPLAGLQAMAGGLAVIGSDVPGVREIVEPGANGLLVPEGDTAALAAAIAELAADRDLCARMGQRSREIAESYRWERIGQAYMTAYTSALNRSRSACP